MDSAVLLDLLGNENRRRILRLLSHKPCYVTEISEYLGVSPKAVIDHLRRLEEAGLVESRTDDQRRKYFHISRHLRLEVDVSPYGFGARSAYPASTSLDMRSRCPHVSVDLDLPSRNGRGRHRGGEDDDGSDPRSSGDDREGGDGGDVSALAAELRRLEELESELSLARRWVHGRMTDVLDRLTDHIGTNAESRFYAEVLGAVATGARTPDAVADEVDASRGAVEDAVALLREKGLLERTPDGYRVASGRRD
jgi:ArsR family transcriptional regulator